MTDEPKGARCHLRRLGTLATGYTVKKLEEFLFDTVLYAYVVFVCTQAYGVAHGSLVAFAIMMPLSAIACVIYLKIYDSLKTDYLGLEALKALKDSTSSSLAARVGRKLLRSGDLGAFFLLSLQGDAFMTVIYLRRGDNSYNGMTRRDWMIFFSSIFVSNAYWTLRWVAIVEVVVYLWHLIRGA